MTDLLAHLSAPAPSKPSKPTSKPAGESGSKPAPIRFAARLTDSILKRKHAQYAAAGEMRVLFGATADRTAVVGVNLRAVARIARDGTEVSPEIAAVHTCTAGPAGPRMVFANTTQPVAYGVTLIAPTAGKSAATHVLWCVLLGYGLDGPQVFAMSATPGKPTFETATDATVRLSNGLVQSFRVLVRPTSGDKWAVPTCHVYSGGPTPETETETLALAALDAREAGEIALLDAADALRGDASKVKPAVANRVKVNTAKRNAASVKPATGRKATRSKPSK